MATSKPTIVIIGGGWHKPNSYSKLQAALETAGYEVSIPEYASMNEARPPTGDLTMDTAIVRDCVSRLLDTGRTVVAILHSYGGQVGTNALHGLGTEARKEKNQPGGVSHLIYMCGFALAEGGSMVGLVKTFGDGWAMPVAFPPFEDGCVRTSDDRTVLIGDFVGEADETEIKAYLDSLRVWNGKCMDEEIDKCAWDKIPASYIFTAEDTTVPLDKQQFMVDRMRKHILHPRKIQFSVELETGHSPNLTKTKEVVNFVNYVVAGTAT